MQTPTHIPSYQTLGPSSGWKLQRRKSLPYPLSYDRIQRYFLGRNAVYHGVNALSLGEGDEILFPAYHSGTESAPLMHLNCKLKLYGVNRRWQVDPAEIESLITPSTRAIYLIHFFGFPGPIQEVRELADHHNIALIEDVALSFLARLGDRPLGTWGDISIFCLYKSLTVPAGGVLAVNRPDVVVPTAPWDRSTYSELNLAAKHVLNHMEMYGGPIGRWINRTTRKMCGRAVRKLEMKLESPEALDYEPGLLDRKMGFVTRALLPWINYQRVAERRRANFRWFVERLRDSNIPLVRDELPDYAVPLFLPVLVENKLRAVEKLAAEGIESIPVWSVHHHYVPRGQFPDVEFLENHVIEVPLYHTLEERHLEQIAATLERLNFGKCRFADQWHDQTRQLATAAR